MVFFSRETVLTYRYIYIYICMCVYRERGIVE